jgi:environmental stress-induced protein Ves
MDGPCTDLNLMVCKTQSGVRAAVERLTAARALDVSPAATAIVFAVEGSVVLEAGAESTVLHTWDCAIVSDADFASLRAAAEPPAALVFLATVDDNSLPVNA